MHRAASSHTVRRGVTSLAVLAVSSAGLTLSLAPAANAETSPAQRAYSYQAISEALNTTFTSSDPDTMGLQFGYVHDSGSKDAQMPYAENLGSASNTNAYGHYDNTDALTAWASVSASDQYENEDWQPRPASSPGGDLPGVFSIGQSDSVALAKAGPNRYNCVPAGDILSEASSTTRDINFDPYTYNNAPVDVVDLVGPVTTHAVTRMVDNGGDQTRGLRTVVDGGAGTYTFLDDSLTIHVVSGAQIVSLADGVHPATADVTAAVVEATDATGGTRRLPPGSKNTFTDATNPDISITIAVPDGALYEELAPDGTAVQSTTNAFRAQLAVAGQDLAGADYAEVGTATVVSNVPLGGVDCTPQTAPPTPPVTPTPPTPTPPVTPTDPDHDGLSTAREHRLGTNPHRADTDRDGLRDGVEIRGITTRRLHAVKTNPLRADTDRDGLKDGVEVHGYTNARYHRTFTSNPRLADSDSDGLRDKAEVTGARNRKFHHEPTSPWLRDTDHGGVSDLREIRAGSNPADIHSAPRHP